MLLGALQLKQLGLGGFFFIFFFYNHFFRFWGPLANGNHSHAVGAGGR